MKKIVNPGKTFRKIKQVGKTLERLDPKKVGKLLGAEIVSTNTAKGGSPISLFALRQYVFENLHSSGGRPCLETSARRQKIPLSDESWAALITLTEILRNDGIAISPGQMANALIRQGLALLNILSLPETREHKTI